MKRFYSGAEAAVRYDEIIPAYQRAFAGPPWFEVTKCADEQRRCPGGLGATALQAICTTCERRPIQPAYTAEELRARFDGLNQKRPVSWYLETSTQGLTLAALAWPANAQVVAEEKYADVPAMRDWLSDNWGDADFVWLDEVFADKTKQGRGNLQNFGLMCRGFGDQLGCDQLMYRTITPQMLSAPERDFGDQAQIINSAPDRRTLVSIDLGGGRP